MTAEHRDNCGAGCSSAALLDEIGRRPESTKKAYSDNLLQLVDSFQEHLSDLDTEQAKSLVFAIYSLLIGTLQLARAMSDEKISNAVLLSGHRAALALLENP